MKPAELRDLSPDELAQKEQELREEFFNLKIQHATGQLDNTARLGQVKKDIARVCTLLKENVQKRG